MWTLVPVPINIYYKILKHALGQGLESRPPLIPQPFITTKPKHLGYTFSPSPLPTSQPKASLIIPCKTEQLQQEG